MMSADSHRPAWERFLSDGDERSLLAAVEAAALTPPDVDYPHLHRVCDVRLAGQTFRVLRLVDVDDGDERVYLIPIEPHQSGLDTAGVPYELRGEALREWVQNEASDPSDEDVDWSRSLNRTEHE